MHALCAHLKSNMFVFVRWACILGACFLSHTRREGPPKMAVPSCFFFSSFDVCRRCSSQGVFCEVIADLKGHSIFWQSLNSTKNVQKSKRQCCGALLCRCIPNYVLKMQAVLRYIGPHMLTVLILRLNRPALRFHCRVRMYWTPFIALPVKDFPCVA